MAIGSVSSPNSSVDINIGEFLLIWSALAPIILAFSYLVKNGVVLPSPLLNILFSFFLSLSSLSDSSLSSFCSESSSSSSCSNSSFIFSSSLLEYQIS